VEERPVARATGHPFEVTPELIQDYERDGVVLLRRPFERSVVDVLASRMETIVENAKNQRSDLVVRASPGRMDVYNVIRCDEAFRRFILESRAGEISARVARSSTAKFYFDVTFCKFGAEGDAAACAATSLHHDIAAFGFKGFQLPSMWLALTDVPPDAGPVFVAIGSHRFAPALFRSAGNYNKQPIESGYLDHSAIYRYIEDSLFELRAFPVEAGDALILHPFVVHGSLPMQDPNGRRIGFCTRWIGDDVRWRPSPYTLEETRSYRYELTEGSPPPDNLFPLVWQVSSRAEP
jgi:ectoine hydroxylase-related dioxygenase (phytanoyl-CoA dioxygenase family)